MGLPTSLTLPHGGVASALARVAEGSAGVVLTGVLDGARVGVKMALDGDASRLAREAIARAVAAVGRPIDGGEANGKPFLVFEWVDGEPSSNARVDASTIEAIERSVGASLARLHLLGYRHGDVKPENVVVSDGRAALVDFGLAAPMHEPLAGATPAWLPPEVLEGGVDRVGAEADVFALGRVIEALAARAGVDLASFPFVRLATSKRPGDRPSAAKLARWDAGVPLDAAYLVARLPEIERCDHAPPEGPARAWLAGVMRALAGLRGRRAEGAALAPLDASARRALLVRVVGRASETWTVPRAVDEATLLEALERRGRSVSRGDFALETLHDDDLGAALAALARSPGDEEALSSLASAAIANARSIDPRVATSALALLRRAGLLDAARAVIAARPRPVGAEAIEAAEVLRVAKDLPGARALLEGASSRAADALRARIALDAGEVPSIEADDESAEVAALAAWRRGDLDAGLALLDRASFDDPERSARALLVRGMLLHARGDATGALRAFSRAGDLALAIGALPLEATARTNAAAAAHDAGKLGQALDASSRAIALLERLQRKGDLATARLNRAATLLALGATTDARIEAERAQADAQEGGDARAAAYALFTQVEAAPEENGAIARAELARTLLGDDPTPSDALLALSYLALAGAAVDVADGERRYERAEPPARWAWLLARLSQGDVAALERVQRASDVDAPASTVGLALARAIELSRANGRGDAARALGERLGALVARLEDDLPLERRASFDAQPSVAATRATAARSEDLGLGAGQIDLLASIARGLRDRTSLGDLLRQVVDGLVLWVGVERGVLLLRAPDGTHLVPRVARGLSREDLRGEQLALSMTLAKRALDTLEPVVAVDAEGSDSVSASIHALRLRSVLAVPLVARGEPLGVVYLDDRIRRGAFGPREVAWVRLLATQAAAAIADARDALRLRRLARRAQRAQARLEAVLAQTEGALEVARAELRERGTRHRYDAIVGDGAAIRRTLSVVDRVTDAADARIPVLILGESGTGKELIARAIHENGPRKNGPFVGENCGAIPEPLLESTLFGHVRGAFTGADRTRVGLFEIANGGTLLLDEIGEMSLPMQAKLLRVLQEGEVRPVGGERATKVDVRVIGATHRDLEAMVREGKFREDLYYRLAVVTIAVPPLRDRSEDLPALVDHFVRRWSGSRKVRVTKNALAVLAAAPWPGNIRQLENELRRAMVLCDDVLDVEHLSPELLRPKRLGKDGEAGLSLREQLDALERRLVTDALRRAGGNQTHAARALGVSRFGLQKMIKRLGLPVKPAREA